MLKKPGFKSIFVLELIIRQASMQEILQQIRIDLRRSMNGVTSKSMREKGLNYRLNFGVDIPRLRDLSKRYPVDIQLAELLWKQETRELKILATILCPASEFNIEKAEKWVKEIPNQEIREQVCMNLFQKLSFADELVQSWTNSADEEIRTSGYWLLARLLIVKSDMVRNIDQNKLMDKMVSDLGSESYFLRFSAQNALKFLGRTSKELSQKVLIGIQDFQTSDDMVKNEIFESLSFEFIDYLD